MFLVYDWFTCIKDAEETIKNNPKSGCPYKLTTDNNIIEKVREILSKDPKVSFIMLVEALEVSNFMKFVVVSFLKNF